MRPVRVLVLHGVNFDMLGRRDPRHYGRISLRELEQQIVDWGSELEIDVSCKQTNAEGLYVEWIHDACDWADGVIVNPGAWTHYSYAIRDALELLSVPLVEVHLSAIEEREDFRRHSVISEIASMRVSGKGPEGYRVALQFLKEHAA
jgi:3-dehydroquinate dehydratase-2